MTDDRSPYFDYVSWAQLRQISIEIAEEPVTGITGNEFAVSSAMMFTLKLLSAIYDTEEEILKDILVTDIIKLRDAIENGTPDDVARTKKWLTSYLKEKYEVNRFELIDFDD